MTGRAWFEMIGQTPTVSTINAAEDCLACMTAGKTIKDDEGNEVGVMQHVPWPALHQSIADSIETARISLNLPRKDRK